ncbi:MAG: hypothetical protein J7K40_01475 [candidate division Zixibacteria bacterium]|nr:hypothetical protein [candidate division Zixibacteria bacterium]
MSSNNRDGRSGQLDKIEYKLYWQTAKAIGIGERYIHTNLDKIDSQTKTAVEKYCDNRYYKKGIGLFITGSMGVGKTSISAYIAYRIIKSCGINCLKNDPYNTAWWTSIAKDEIRFCHSSELHQLFRYNTNSDANNKLGKLKQVRYLIIDDFGCEFSSAYGFSQFEGFYAYRHDERFTTIINSNIPLVRLKENSELARTFDRFRESMKVIEITGKSLRG